MTTVTVLAGEVRVGDLLHTHGFMLNAMIRTVSSVGASVVLPGVQIHFTVRSPHAPDFVMLPYDTLVKVDRA